MVTAGEFIRPDGSKLTWKATEWVGRVLVPTRYKGIVVGMKRYHDNLEHMFKLARLAQYGQKGTKSVWFNYNCDNPYKQWCEDPKSAWHKHNWEDHLPATFTSKNFSIQQLIDGQLDAAEVVMKGLRASSTSRSITTGSHNGGRTRRRSTSRRGDTGTGSGGHRGRPTRSCSWLATTRSTTRTH
jgi:hypothetical protein